MKRINLARKGKKTGGSVFGLDITGLFSRSKGGSSSSQRSSGASDTKFSLNKAPIIKVIIAIGLLYFADSEISKFKETALKKFSDQNAITEKKIAEAQAILAKSKGNEEQKAQLEEERNKVRQKLSVLQELLENRNAPARMLLQVSQTIPEDVWLSDMKLDGNDITLSGGTSGFNFVSDFLRSLNKSSQFTDLTIKGIEENEVSPDLAQRFQSFVITAKRRQLY